MADRPDDDAQRTRRAFLRDAGLVAGTAAVGWASGDPAAVARPPAKPPARRARKPTVAVLGGGVSGLTAAHELAERGFDVTIYERRAWGGKARSFDVPGSVRAGSRRPLPGEHGYRIVFGGEQHLPDTMRRIPFAGNTNGVFDNLVPAPQLTFARTGKRDLPLPLGALDLRPFTPQQILDLVTGLLLETNLPPAAVAYFANRVLVFLTSSDERRKAHWDTTSWADFIRADRYGDDYRKILALPYTQIIQASKAEETSTKFAGSLLELILYNTVGRGANGPLVRILNLPTNEAWIDPWTSLLGKLGVQLRLGHTVTGLKLRGGRIAGATVRSRRGGTRVIQADWYICALPVEKARLLWTAAMRAADPQLARMSNLRTDWMTGIQFFLRERTPIVNGHYICVDTPWMVSGISQAQFWPRDFAATYGDGHVKDCFSAIVSDWHAPGVVYGKPATDCTPDQVATEVWAQLKQAANDTGKPILADDLLHSWQLDPGMVRRNGRFANKDPLVLPVVGAWANQPEVTTAISNLLLAGDYPKGEWEVANMEAANHNARNAVNALLHAANSRESPCTSVAPYSPPELAALKRADADRFRRGERNAFDGG